jgi:Ras-related protein Rab-18
VGARAVTTAEGKALAHKFGAGFVEVSSKTRENVKMPFVDMVDRIVENPELMNSTRRRREGVNFEQGKNEGGGTCAC